MVPFESLGTVSYSHSIYSNCGCILYHFQDNLRDIGGKSHLTSPLGGGGGSVGILPYSLVLTN